MKFVQLILCAVFAAVVSATAFQVKVKPQEVTCFNAQVQRAGQKILFYYAVQKGGNFDIRARVKTPAGHISYDKTAKMDEYVMTSDQGGEYEFCFNNHMSTFDEKTVDFEIKLEHEELRAELPADINKERPEHASIENSLNKISPKIDSILSEMRYLKVREARNKATVESTESRIYWFSVLEIVLMVGISVCQVTIVQVFFRGSRKQLV